RRAVRLRRRQRHVPPQRLRILALRGGGAGDAERDVPGGARHRQRPLLGPLRLPQVRPPLLARIREFEVRRVQPAQVEHEPEGPLQQQPVRSPDPMQQRRKQELPLQHRVPVGQHVVQRGAHRGRPIPCERVREVQDHPGPHNIRVQTGSFLGSAAPNGLLGLGMDSKSVPSLLASQGVAANSFSMCFGEDGHGRINFGDTGSADQLETPLNIYKHNPYYNISIIGAMAGGKTFSTKFSAVVDSGTSFTALSDPMYTEITSAFDKQVKEKRNQADSSLPFEYCYTISAKGALSHPNISLTAKGGSIFPVNDPIITITDISSSPVGYCLAIMKSEGVNLIGGELLYSTLLLCALFF
uniref:Peptidase A1 domain-containing protein n=1 Tax=Aegilops tauschii subsp. strangulata TaxID=200361 RepID=A0A453LHL1_AEGTS